MHWVPQERLVPRVRIGVRECGFLVPRVCIGVRECGFLVPRVCIGVRQRRVLSRPAEVTDG